MSLPIASAVGLFLCLAGFVAGLRFRQGTSRPAAYLRSYRNADLPASIRNLPIVLPLLTGLLLPSLLLLSAKVFLESFIDLDLPDPIIGFLLLVSFGLLFLGVGTTASLSFRPPRRLMPDWLVEEDARIGFRSPDPDRFDKLMFILFGPPFVVAGAALLVAGLVYLVASA
jgi:hypothetical protein